MSKNEATTPTTPDYAGIAKAQSQASRFNQITPFGQSTWNNDTNTQTNSLSPEQQAILAGQQQYSTGVNTAINNALPGVNLSGIDSSKLAAAPINAGQTAQDAIMSRLQPTLERQREQMRTQLANQGIGQGTEAYNNAYNDQNQRENDLYTQAALQGINASRAERNAGIQEQTAMANQPINSINALRNGSVLNVPTFSNQGSAPDLTGAANNAYNAQTGLYNVNTTANNNLQNGLFGLLGTALSSYPWKT